MNSEKKIKVFDDVFDYQMREYVYNLAKNSNFKIGWEDTPIIEHREKVFLHSMWQHENAEFINKGFIPSIKNRELLELIGGRQPSLIVLNCTLKNDIYLPHTHIDQDVLLYYINMEWKREWYGETQFFSENLNEIIFTNPYVPGRMVWFDGTIPHTIKTQSSSAPKYRFSVSLFFEKLNNKLNSVRSMEKTEKLIKFDGKDIKIKPDAD